MFKKLAGISLISVLFCSGANAELSLFNTWSGSVGYSSDGFGSLSQQGVLSAYVPSGSTVLGAYLYTSLYNANPSANYTGGVFNGSVVGFNNLGGQQSINRLSAGRSDVTSIVAPIINNGAGGVYNFNVTEYASVQDGEALVVVYSNPALSNRTFALLDGFASTTGDTATVNFSNPLNPSISGFEAEMFLGINFSCCNQKSTITVNDVVITNNAGNNDDGVGLTAANGQLITVGGYDDPFSPHLPTYEEDHERYNLVPYIDAGDKSIVINTINPSNDDNIFLAGFYVSGLANVSVNDTSTIPEPETYAMFLIGLGLLGFVGPRKQA